MYRHFLVNKEYAYRYKLLIAVTAFYDGTFRLLTGGLFCSSLSMWTQGLAIKDFVFRMKKGGRLDILM